MFVCVNKYYYICFNEIHQIDLNLLICMMFDCTGNYNPSGSQAKPVFSMESSITANAVNGNCSLESVFREWF
jgi:hypothetical protein